jgi:hypothetical protein
MHLTREAPKAFLAFVTVRHQGTWRMAGAEPAVESSLGVARQPTEPMLLCTSQNSFWHFHGTMRHGVETLQGQSCSAISVFLFSRAMCCKLFELDFARLQPVCLGCNAQATLRWNSCHHPGFCQLEARHQKSWNSKDLQ